MASAAPQKRMVSSVFITLATPHRATVTPSARRGSTHSAAQRDEHTATRASPRDGVAAGPPPATHHDAPRDAPAPASAASHTPSPSSTIPPGPTPAPLPPAAAAPAPASAGSPLTAGGGAGRGAAGHGSTEEFLPPPPPPPMAPDSELCTDLGPPMPPPPPLEPSTIIQPEPPLPVCQSEPIHSAPQKGTASEQQPGERALPGGGNPNNPTERIQPGLEDEAEPESRDLCGFCRKLVALTDPAIEALNRTYHANCFQCRQCQVPLAGKMYYNKAGIPLCEDCYLASLEQCWACGEVIKDHVIRALERVYHPACFICTTCSRPIGEERFAQGEVGEVYCLPDYYRKYAPQCSACQQLIIPSEDGKDSFTVECLGRSFHEDCYRCEICSISLSTEPNEQGCYPLDGRILCKPCHVTLLQEGHP